MVVMHAWVLLIPSRPIHCCLLDCWLVCMLSRPTADWTFLLTKQADWPRPKLPCLDG